MRSHLAFAFLLLAATLLLVRTIHHRHLDDAVESLQSQGVSCERIANLDGNVVPVDRSELLLASLSCAANQFPADASQLMTDDPLDDDDRQRVIPNIEMSKRLLKNNPDEVVGLHNLAWALILTGKSAEGMDVLHRLSLEVGSHRWFFLLSYAAALTRAGLHNRAREALVDALAEEPLISNSHLVALLCERNSLELLKVEDEAGLKLAKIVGAASLSRLALMNALEGNNRKAEDMFKAALSRQPSMSGAWYFLSRVELCNSQASEARLSFRRASFLGWRNTAIDVEAQFNSELERRYAFRHIGLSPIFPLGLALAANIPMRDATHFCGVGTK